MNSKYKSRRFLICLWAVLLSSCLMVGSLYLKYEPAWMATALPVLLGIILSFVGIESWKKPRGNNE